MGLVYTDKIVNMSTNSEKELNKEAKELEQHIIVLRKTMDNTKGSNKNQWAAKHIASRIEQCELRINDINKILRKNCI